MVQRHQAGVHNTKQLLIMKKRHNYLIYIALIAAVLTACTKEIPHSIKPEYTQYAFNSDSSTITICIESISPEWSADTDCPWLSAKKYGEDSLEISVSINTELDTRTGHINLSDGYATATITVLQEGRSFNGKMRDLPEFWPKTTTSHNGRYIVGGCYIDIQGSSKLTITIIDTETGEKSHLKEYTFPEKYSKIVAISDDASKILINDAQNIAKLLSIDKAGNISEQGFTPCNEYSTADAVAMDATGTTVVLYAAKEYDKYPAMAVNGTITILDTPDKDPIGQDLPARNISLEGCTADGTTIYGYEVLSTCQGLIYWKNGKCYNAGADNADEPRSVKISIGSWVTERTVTNTVSLSESLDCIRSSPNSKYLAARYIYYQDNAPDEPVTIYEYPALVNLETGEVKIIKTDILSIKNFTVDNTGNMFCISSDRKGYVFDANTGTGRTISQYFEEEHNVLLADDRSVSYADSANGIYFGLKDQTTYWHMRTK